MGSKQKVAHRISTEEFEKFADEFKNESNRAAVILGTSQLDLPLYQLMETFLLPNASSKNELLGGDSPFSTFSSRINIRFRLGLIDAEFCRALHLVRKIRNSFAHEVPGVSLESGSHRGRIKELVAPFVDNWALARTLKEYFDWELAANRVFVGLIYMYSTR